jgi:hypothetical protein
VLTEDADFGENDEITQYTWCLSLLFSCNSMFWAISTQTVKARMEGKKTGMGKDEQVKRTRKEYRRQELRG